MDEMDILNELRLMQKQMNTMFGLAISSKKNQDLLDAHNKAVEARQKAKEGSDLKKTAFEETYIRGQKETNDYLSRLIKTTDTARAKERNTSLNPASPGFSMNPINILNNIGKLVEKDQGRSGVISSALKLPAGLLNFSKDILRKKELKKIDTGRKDFNVQKELLEAKELELARLKKDSSGRARTTEEKTRIDELKSKIDSITTALDKKATDLAIQVEKQQRKEEKNLDSKRFAGISKEDIASIRDTEREKIKTSFLSDLQTKSKSEKIRNTPVAAEKKANGGVIGNVTAPLSGISAKVSPNKRSVSAGTVSIEDRILNKKVAVGPGTPSTFGDVVGGIYYRLGTMIENLKKPGDKTDKEDGGGFLSSLLGMAGGFLLSKLGPILKGFSMLKSGLGALGKMLGGFGRSIGGLFSKITGPISKLFGKETVKETTKVAATSASKIAAKGGATLAAKGAESVASKGVAKGAETAAKVASKTGIKVAAEEGIKGTGKIGAKFAGKEALKLGGKTAAKSLAKKIPFLGAGVGALFAAQRAFGGDFKGAGLELASGATSFLPGAGTVAGLGIDAYLLKRDLDRAKNKNNAAPQPEPEQAEVSPLLQNQTEVDRTKMLADSAKMQEESFYRALKRYGKEDMESNEPTRAKINANAILNGSM